MKSSWAVVSLVTIWTASQSRAQMAKPHPQPVGGVMAQIEDFPHHVSMWNMFGSLSCGGSILTRYWILTTAQCGEINDLQVVAGYDFFNKSDMPDARGVTLRRCQSGEKESLCLLRVDTPFDFNGESVRPIALPFNQEHKQFIALNVTGLSEIFIRGEDVGLTLKVATLYHSPPGYCNPSFPLKGRDNQSRYMCMGESSVTGAACVPTPGSGAVSSRVKSGGHQLESRVLIGVALKAEVLEDNHCGLFAIYRIVSSKNVLDWIEQAMEKPYPSKYKVKRVMKTVKGKTTKKKVTKTKTRKNP